MGWLEDVEDAVVSTEDDTDWERGRSRYDSFLQILRIIIKGRHRSTKVATKANQMTIRNLIQTIK